jgi:hypothetical protein
MYLSNMKEENNRNKKDKIYGCFNISMTYANYIQTYYISFKHHWEALKLHWYGLGY